MDQMGIQPISRHSLQRGCMRMMDEEGSSNGKLGRRHEFGWHLCPHKKINGGISLQNRQTVGCFCGHAEVEGRMYTQVIRTVGVIKRSQAQQDSCRAKLTVLISTVTDIHYCTVTRETIQGLIPGVACNNYSISRPATDVVWVVLPTYLPTIYCT